RLESISYLGPLRLPPAPLYSWSGNTPTDVGWEGANTVQCILASSGRSLNWTAKARTTPFEEVIAARLVAMDLAHSFSVREIAPDRSEYEVTIRIYPGS